MDALILKPDREKSLLRRHPWVFSGAIQQVIGDPASGATVEIFSADRQFLARAAYSPTSQIRARVWTFDPDEMVDVEFFRRKIRNALERRAAWNFSPRDSAALQPASGAMRLIHAESDGLPGLVVDRYGDVLVLQVLTAGVEFWRETLADLLLEVTGARAIYERSDADVRALEGLPPRTGLLRGTLPATRLTIDEDGLKFIVDVAFGHKTGFYLDQHLNRRRVGQLAAGREVLNCFCYTGAFSLHALAGGATEVVSIESSGPALETARRTLALNAELAGCAFRAQWRQADVFATLRSLATAGSRFDLVILDPPKFAPSSAHAAAAARAYKDINLFAFRLLAPGGLLMSFSCSGGVSPEMFRAIVAEAARDAPREARVLRRLGAGADHPVALGFPEGEYLKGLLCQAD